MSSWARMPVWDRVKEGIMCRRYLAGLLLLAATSWLVWAAPRADQKATDAARTPDGWMAASPRDEIRPAFAYEPSGGPGAKGAFVIKHDRREGLDGCWTKKFLVHGGKYYHFEVRYQARGVDLPRRSIVAKLDWRDTDGNKVLLDEPAVTGYLRGATPQA